MVEKLGTYRNFPASDFPYLTTPNHIESVDLVSTTLNTIDHPRVEIVEC